ncbi:MAG: DUF3990 domain-containing protein [Bacteroidales bacterium]|nr:DUF3990 domain-containing protein [Bacteroidales bacterium]
MKMDKQILFHGSDVIVEHPLVNLGRKDLDFGTGFYLTPLFEQASQWATRVRTIRKAERAIVNVYEFTSTANCRIKRFDSYDKEWLDFIVESRTGKQPWKGFDIIEGGIANDRVIDAVEAYIQGYADVEHTLRQLIYQKPNYQICILNQDIVDKHLRFQSHERV